jgi:hypothetical protein
VFPNIIERPPVMPTSVLLRAPLPVKIKTYNLEETKRRSSIDSVESL